MRILTIGAATALSLALAAAPAPAATPYGWTPTVQLSAAGQPAWDADVAYSASGSAVIAWGRYAGIMDYNPNSKTVFVPHGEENVAKI